MTISHLELLNKNKFSKQLSYLANRLKNKRIVIYGAGQFFQTIADNYDLSVLNIVAISDRNIDEEGVLLGYPSCPLSRICNYAPDYILVGSWNYIDIIEKLEVQFDNIPIFPLVKKNVTQIWKEVWG